MNNGILNLIDYFQSEANDFDNVFNKTKGFTNADAGANREISLLTFLKHHIPSRTKISSGGYVFDSNGNKLNQIDLLLTTDSTLQFNQSLDSPGKVFNCTEGCGAAISVKTNLDKKDLYDSIDNLSSIPLEKNFIFTNRNFSPSDLRLEKIPLKIIFAYKGQSLEKTKKDLVEYYQTHNQNKKYKFDFLIVNNKYAFTNISQKHIDPLTGQELSEGYGVWSKTETDSIGGLILFRLLMFLQEVGSIMKNVDVDFDKYYQQMNLMDPLRKHSFG